jgi:glycosyltransferase involved in cell wall biosynthesis
VVSGWLLREEVVHRLRGADAYLHTAEWEAGYPLSLLEAGALDLPLVVRAIPSLVDLPLPLAHSPEQAAAQLRSLLNEPTRTSAVAATRSWIAELSGTPDREQLSSVYRAAAGTRC